MLQRTKEDYLRWLKSADYQDKDYQNIIKNLKDEELPFFYATYMTFASEASQKFIDFIKKYKEVY